MKGKEGGSVLGIAECKIPGGGERDQEKSERGGGGEKTKDVQGRCDKERGRLEGDREGGERERERDGRTREKEG